MHIIKNSRGIEVVYQSPTLKNCWGHIDEKGDYITDRDTKRGQIFHLFNNAIAIQLDLLKYLENKYPHGNIRVFVNNYEKETFCAVCPINKFRGYALQWQKTTGKPAIFNYDTKDYKKYGQQIRLPINSFTRKYLNQQILNS